jgi:hypothetical protein
VFIVVGCNELGLLLVLVTSKATALNVRVLFIMASQPHLVSLVVQSKKALQHGEQLCSRANSLSNESAQCAMDVLALDAKIRWATEAVLEQLKVPSSRLRILH